MVLDLAPNHRGVSFRATPSEHGATFPNQKGKRIHNPTARWVFHYFVGIHLLCQVGQWPQVLNLTEEHANLLKLLGPPYMQFYDVKYSKKSTGHAECRIERIFNRLKSRLQIAPLFVKRDDQIEGLTYLLTLGVRVLTVMEFTLQRSLQKEQASLAGMHLENRKKRTDQPSAERVLKAVSKVTLTIMKDGEGRELGRWLTPLSTVQQDILYHLGWQSSLYSQLEIHNT